MPPLQRISRDDLSDSEHSQIDATPQETGEVKVLVAPFDDSDNSRKSVRFGSIQVREYNRVVGDHPDVRVGPPMSIGWDFVEHDVQPLDQYEADHPHSVLRRMSSITRKNMLSNVFGVPEEEIRAAEKEVQAILKSRDRSKKQSKIAAKTGGVRRKMKKMFLGETFMKGLAAAAGAMTMGPGSAGMAVY